MLQSEYSDSVFFRASCSCGDSDCDQHLCLELLQEKDENLIVQNEVQLGIETKIKFMENWADWENRWHRVLWRRLIAAFRCIFKGYLEFDTWFVFDGKEAIRDYIDALEYGLERLKRFEEKENVN